MSIPRIAVGGQAVRPWRPTNSRCGRQNCWASANRKRFSRSRQRLNGLGGVVGLNLPGAVPGRLRVRIVTDEMPGRARSPRPARRSPLTRATDRKRGSLSASTEALRTAIGAALATVNDPEINRPITELGMVKSVDVADDGAVAIGVYLTVSGCPMRDEITGRVTNAVSKVEGVTRVSVELDVMRDEQRTKLRTSLRGD